jgi:hypothetical protein
MKKLLLPLLACLMLTTSGLRAMQENAESSQSWDEWISRHMPEKYRLSKARLDLLYAAKRHMGINVPLIARKASMAPHGLASSFGSFGAYVRLNELAIDDQYWPSCEYAAHNTIFHELTHIKLNHGAHDRLCNVAKAAVSALSMSVATTNLTQQYLPNINPIFYAAPIIASTYLGKMIYDRLAARTEPSQKERITREFQAEQGAINTMVQMDYIEKAKSKLKAQLMFLIPQTDGNSLRGNYPSSYQQIGMIYKALESANAHEEFKDNPKVKAALAAVKEQS